MCAKNVRKASSPPAEAPMPMTRRGVEGFGPDCAARGAFFVTAFRPRTRCFDLDARVVMANLRHPQAALPPSLDHMTNGRCRRDVSRLNRPGTPASAVFFSRAKKTADICLHVAPCAGALPRASPESPSFARRSPQMRPPAKFGGSSDIPYDSARDRQRRAADRHAWR